MGDKRLGRRFDKAVMNFVEVEEAFCGLMDGCFGFVGLRGPLFFLLVGGCDDDGATGGIEQVAFLGLFVLMATDEGPQMEEAFNCGASRRPRNFVVPDALFIGRRLMRAMIAEIVELALET